jgi:lipopolysaccharide/colanic/teichoic acid biosynthesis glycosyltransferase
MDLFGSLFLLVPALPLMTVAAALVGLTSRGPILFKQVRAGKDGQSFRLLKFRTMVDGRRNPGAGVTRLGDARITFIGRFLRRWKLDELPQLLNVLNGSMSLVGPRPDLFGYWNRLPTQASEVLSVRPGITGPATLEFRNEELLLAALPEDAVEEYYITNLLPLKVSRDLEYLERASLNGDLKILAQTLMCVFTGKPKVSN